MAKKKKSTVPGGGVRIDLKPILAVVVAVALCAATWFLFTGPQREKAATQAAARAAAQAKLAGHEAELAKLRGGGGTEAAKMLARAQELDRLLPAAPNKVALVAEVDALARSRGVKLLQLNPGAVAAAAPNRPHAATFDGSASGPASAVNAFLAELTSRAPLMTIGKATLTSSSGDGRSETTVSFTLNVWYVEAATLTGESAAGQAGQPGQADQSGQPAAGAQPTAGVQPTVAPQP